MVKFDIKVLLQNIVKKMIWRNKPNNANNAKPLNFHKK